MDMINRFMGEQAIENANVVVVGSGITGLETAEILGEHNNKITVLEMGKEIAPGGWHQIIDDELTRINRKTTTFLCSAKLLRIHENTVEVENLASGATETIPADYVVLSMGVRPINHLAAELRGKTKVITVGDAVKSGTIANACHSAHESAMTIQ
jgi:pyruvate/2-oxoglutarate dehydrogenase complex dihydrolipoamide dehydrogenase (E3) component